MGDAAPVTVECTGDGSSFSVARSSFASSQLFQSLPTLPTEVNVPFSGHELAAWQAFKGGARDGTFLHAVAALQVSDFLHDEDTAAAAAKQANCHIQGPWSGPLSEDEIAGLEALQPHLLGAVLHASGDVCGCLCALPAACQSMAVSAAVRGGSLRLNSCPEALMDQIGTVLASLSDLLQSLELGFEPAQMCAVSSCRGEQLAGELGCLTQLECLELTNVHAMHLPVTLSALTRLRLTANSNDMSRSCWPDLFGDISTFSLLKELELHSVYSPTSDFANLSCCLNSLTNLTSFQLWHRNFSNAQAEVCADALATCTSLVSLSIASSKQVTNPHVRDDWSAVGEPVVRALARLTELTSLKLGGQIGHRCIQEVWQQLPHLVHLHINSVRSWGDAVAFRHLLCLKSFVLTGFNIDGGVLDTLVAALPEPLTALHLDGHVQRAIALELPFCFTNLQSLTLAGFQLPRCARQKLALCTTLTKFSTCKHGRAQIRGREYLSTWSKDYHEELLAMLPASITDLNIADGDEFTADAVPHLVALTALRHLHLGRILSNDAALSLARRIRALPELRSFSAEWAGSALGVTVAQLNPPACEEMLRSLKKLPHLAAKDARPRELVSIIQGTV